MIITVSPQEATIASLSAVLGVAIGAAAAATGRRLAKTPRHASHAYAGKGRSCAWCRKAFHRGSHYLPAGG